MNKGTDQQTRLPTGTLPDDWASGPAAPFARAAAATARRHRRTRALLSAAGATALIAVASFVGIRSHHLATPISEERQLVARAQPAYEIISDEELLTQLPELAMLIESDGRGGKRYTLLQPTSE
jgi:hypothetical protein